MFGIGTTELVIIVIFGFLLFGPDKMPQMGRTIGRALRQFRETQEKLTAVVQTEVVDPMNEIVTEPVKPKKKNAEGEVVEDPDSDADADSDSSETAAPRRTETFAERRARLAAEREQAAAEKAASAEGTDAIESAVLEAAEGAEAAVAVAAEPAVHDGLSEGDAADAAPEEEPAVRTTRDLYARRPRKKKAAPAAAEDAAPEPDAAPAPEPDAEPREGGDE